jgi:tRNA dimethylallyltransferase
VSTAAPPIAPLIAIVGPTGSGKSALALRISRTFSGEIVNCDSVQLYRGFDIGTAKTPPHAREGVPHHLLDVLDPSVRYSAGEYGRSARAAIADISARGNLPVIVGGTGFYLRALLDGLPPLPAREEALRFRLAEREQRRPGSLHRLLTRLEPQAANRIHQRDVQKTMRALEVRLLTGAALPPQQVAEPLAGYAPLILGLSPDRERLAEAIRIRTARMFEAGLIEEVRGLLARACTGAEKPFESLGYKHALAYVQGRLSLPDAISQCEIETRQYAKRQWTWFRRDQRVRWLEGFGEDPEIAACALTLVRKFLDAL